jgi:hypothetical protein
MPGDMSEMRATSTMKRERPLEPPKKTKAEPKKTLSQERAEVKQAFLRKKKLRGGHLYSDGKSLWSYGWWEVARWVRGQVIIRNGRAYSRTTERKHLRGLPGTLAGTETPVAQAKMNL